jgi:DNA adenine methylase
MWAGGKSRMIPKYQSSPGIPYSDYDSYVEPFFGGGAMMLHIATKRKLDTKVQYTINDINKDIMNIYTSIKDSVTEFTQECDKICDLYMPLKHEDRKKYFYEIRNSYINNYTAWNTVKESAVLYFLMKTAFNGIYQSTKASKGRFATPAGLLNQKTEVYDKGNVFEWEELLQRVNIHSEDWKQVPVTSAKSFYFMDPPYRDSFTQYSQVFTDENHKELIDFCIDSDKQGDLVFYCNRSCDDTFYTDNKSQLEIEYYDVTYTAGRRKNNKTHFSAKKAQEILLYSPSLKKNTLFAL